MPPTQAIRLTHDVTLEQAEQISAGALASSRRGASVSIDFAEVRAFQPGAAQRLASCFRIVAEQSSLEIRLPKDHGAQNAVVRLLQVTGLADQVAAYATTIKVGDRRSTQQLRKELRSGIPDSFGVLTHNNLIDSALITSRRVLSVQHLLADWFALFPNAGVKLPADESLRLLARMVAEATWNVQDHSRKRPLGIGTKVSSSLILTWRARDALRIPPEGYFGEQRLSQYLDTALRSEEADRRVSGFIEICVNDDGAGMAGRQSLSLEIYAGPLSIEMNSFTQALAAGGTVKLRALDCHIDKEPGYGSAKIARNISDLYGFASIRSGRLHAFLDGWEEPQEDAPVFTLESRTLSLTAGTTLLVLIPIFARSQPPRSPLGAAQERLF